MHFYSIRNTIPGLLTVLFATSAWGQASFPGLSVLDAAQLNGVPSGLPTQVVTAFCNGSPTSASLTGCTMVTGTIQAGMLVLDVTNPSYIVNPTTTTGPLASGTVPLNQVPANTISGDKFEFVLQQINDQLGQSFAFGGGSPYYANNWELSEGTSSLGASFAGPMLKLSKYEDIENFGNPGECPNQVEGKCNAVLSVGVQSNYTDKMETQGIFVEANSVAPWSACNQCNVSAMQIEVRSSDQNNMEKGWLPSAGRIVVEDDSKSVLSGLKGLEFDMNNNSGVDCPNPGAGGPGACDGVILAKPLGSNNVTYAFHVRGGNTASFFNGFYCDAPVTGSQATSVLQSCLDDESSATNGLIEGGSHTNGILIQGSNSVAAINGESTSANSILIQGSHGTAIDVASAAGPVVLNDNYLWPGAKATGAPYIAADLAPNAMSFFAGNGSTSQEILRMTYTGAVLENGQFITQASQTSPQITAVGGTTTGFYQSASGTWQYASGVTNIATLSSSGLVMAPGTLIQSQKLILTSSPPAVPTGVSYGGTVTVISNCGSLSGSAGCLVIRVGPTLRYIPFY